MKISGPIAKMNTYLSDVVEYNLPISDHLVYMNELIGKTITLKYSKQIICVSCKKETIKSFNQGFCYTCFKSSPAAADWIFHPELSKAHLGIEDRNLAYEQEVQLKPHFVYLSLTSGLKVGVTRESQIPTRWIDQGAVQAIIIAQTPNRYLAGMIEVSLKPHFADKTNWRQMLMNIDPHINLIEEKLKSAQLIDTEYKLYFIEENNITNIKYPVINYPVKITSLSFDTTPEYTGKLVGIKGQYLYFENGIVLNVRIFTGYVITIEA